jgi:hypothetical protein
VYKVDNVENRDNRSKEPADKTIKVSETNRKRINALAGKLASNGDSHSQNEAVNYLFDCLKKLEKMEDSK